MRIAGKERDIARLGLCRNLKLFVEFEKGTDRRGG